ncbi:MAG: magnesium/cobalt transporter CorA [Thermoplasmatota archaeon]
MVGDARGRGRPRGTRAAPKPAAATVARPLDPGEEHLIHVFTFGPDALEEHAPLHITDAKRFIGTVPVTWININSATDRDILRALEKDFGLHALSVEDIRNTHQRPKVEEYDTYTYAVVHMVTFEDGEVRTEQLSIFFGRDWIITVQEKPGDIFNPVRARLRSGSKMLRSAGPDRLAYALVDDIVDSYFPILDTLGAELEAVEDGVIDRPTTRVRADLQRVRRQLITLRRFAWPQRDAVAQLERGESPFITAETRVFLRDVSDHAIRVLDLVETYRDVASAAMDLYLSGLTIRTNEIMRVLTVIGTIFLPLTFVTGVYGMNFDRSHPLNMPELGSPYGYIGVLVFMSALTVFMLVLFRRRGWF